jgi:hypothetical protein
MHLVAFAIGFFLRCAFASAYEDISLVGWPLYCVEPHLFDNNASHTVTNKHQRSVLLLQRMSLTFAVPAPDGHIPIFGTSCQKAPAADFQKTVKCEQTQYLKPRLRCIRMLGLSHSGNLLGAAAVASSNLRLSMSSENHLPDHAQTQCCTY